MILLSMIPKRILAAGEPAERSGHQNQPNSTQFVNPMDINANYSEEDNPLSLKADFILSLCELVVGGKEGLLPVEKTVIDAVCI